MFKRTMLIVIALALVLPVPVVGAAGEEAAEISNITNEITEESTEPLAINKNDSSVDPQPAPEPANETAPAQPLSSSPETSTPDNQASAAPNNPAPLTKQLVISKINPDKPEIVEIYNSENRAVSLAGVKVEFISDNKSITLKQFHDGELAAHEFMTIGDEADSLFDINNKNAITLNGTLRLTAGDYETEVKFGDSTSIKLTNLKEGYRFIQRCQAAGDTFLVSKFDQQQFGTWPDCTPPEPGPLNNCDGLTINEIGANLDEQFIEITNTSSEALNLSGCQLATDRNKNKYQFEDVEIAPAQLLAIKIKDTNLSLHITTGAVYLQNSEGKSVVTVNYKGLAKNTSWSLIDGKWTQTYLVTPGEKNAYQRWQTCDPGKIINESTGNCVKITSKEPTPCGPDQFRNPETGRCKKIEVPKSQTPCREGYYRSEETGRCRSIAAAAKALKPCRDDQFRNPETGRCKKIAADGDVLKECAEGYERNPKTNRCRKIRATSVAKANFPAEQVETVAGATWGWWVFGGVSLLAVGYAGWQWRWELGRLVKRIAGAFTSSGK